MKDESDITLTSSARRHTYMYLHGNVQFFKMNVPFK